MLVFITVTPYFLPKMFILPVDSGNMDSNGCSHLNFFLYELFYSKCVIFLITQTEIHI